MDVRILEHLRAEEAELSRKLDAIRSVISVYAPDRTPGRLVTATLRQRPSVEHVSPRANDYASSVRAAARELIRTSTELPVPTRAIVAKVQEQGIEIRGLNALNAVSALLSRSDEFQSQGRSGWLLTEFANRHGILPAPNAEDADENEAPFESSEGASETALAAQ